MTEPLPPLLVQKSLTLSVLVFALPSFVAVAVDGEDSCLVTTDVPSTLDTISRDIRLPKALPFVNEAGAPRVYAEQRQVIVAPSGSEWRQDGGGLYRVYDNLEKCFHLVCTLLPGQAAVLEEFRFLLRWPHLDAEERTKLYSKYACHELNVFLYLRDRAFFESAIRPHLQNKLRKDLVDCALLGLPLDHFSQPAQLETLNCFELLLVALAEDAELSADDAADIIKDRVSWPVVASRRLSSLGDLKNEGSERRPAWTISILFPFVFLCLRSPFLKVTVVQRRSHAFSLTGIFNRSSARWTRTR